MTSAEEPDLRAVLRTVGEIEQALRQELVQARAALDERDERFAVLEADMWAGFQDRESRHRQLIEEREHESARLRAELHDRDGEIATLRTENARLEHTVQEQTSTIAHLTERVFRLQVRLDRILASGPGRLYASLLTLPVLRQVQRRRAGRYAADLARQRPS